MAIDPYTARRRAIQYTRKRFVEDIKEKQKTNHLNALKIINRVPKGLARIDNWKVAPRQKKFQKALFISRQAARLADAAIDAQIGVENFEALKPNERHKIWNYAYEAAMIKFSHKPYVTSQKELLSQLKFLERFFSLPIRLHYFRQKHWPTIKKVVENTIKKHDDPRAGLEKQITSLLLRNRPGETMKNKGMDICIASSIFADIMERKGENWSTAYQEGMEIAYSKILENQELVDTISKL